MKSLPKKPKATAPLTSWDKWNDRADVVRKENRKKLSEHEKTISKLKSDQKKKETLIKKSQGLGKI